VTNAPDIISQPWYNQQAIEYLCPSGMDRRQLIGCLCYRRLY